MSIDAVDRAITFTEDNLHEQVTVGAMAEAAHYSLYHFCRVFGRYSGLSPHTYLIRRRLTLAVEHVVDSRRRIVQIAHEFGFDSHEGFSRAFGRLFAVTPIEARDRGWVPNPPRLPTLTRDHLACLERHGGLLPVPGGEGDVPDLAGDGVVHVPVPLTWPGGRAPSTGGPEGTTTHMAFRLAGADPGDHALVLDWVVHVWLFVARYELAAPHVLIDHAGTRVTVPVRRGVSRR